MRCKARNYTGSQINTGTLRQSNIELLRIIAMVIIVAHHFARHSGFDFPTSSISVNRLWIRFILLGGKIGVNVFVIISGYFLATSKSTKAGKILKLWLQIFFYSVVIFLGFVIAGLKPFNIKELIKHFSPVIFSQWWFASTYLVLYILSPYINRLLRTFNKRQYIGFMMLLLFGWCIIPTFTGQTLQSNALLWFSFLYSVGAYFKLYKPETYYSAAKLISLSFAFAVLTFLSAVIFDVLGTKISVFGVHATFFYGMQKLPILIASVLLFVGFLKLDIRYNKIINIIASATFGVYLIHDSGYMRQLLWKTLFHNTFYEDKILLIPYSLFVITIVFIGCTLIELFRIYALENNYISSVSIFSEYIDKKIVSFLDKIMDKCK